MIKPRALKKGDTIGLVAPASPVLMPGGVEKAVKVLKEQGFNLVIGESCTKNYGYLSGSDEIRADDINKMFMNSGVDAIFCLRGGYGTPRILDKLNYKMIKRNPKLFIGYSDITAIHIALNQRCNLVTFHGPMVASDMIENFDDFSRESYLKAITGTQPLGELTNPEGFNIGCLVKGVGEVRGEIIGGNLSLITALIGTPYEIDTKDKILFLEDIDEYTYRIDRMLIQLKLAGKLDDCKGIILGDFNNCLPQIEDSGLTLMEVIKDIITPINKPTINNFKAGHCNPKITLPFGTMAILDAKNCAVKIIESALK